MQKVIVAIIALFALVSSASAAQLEWSYAAGYVDNIHEFRTVTAGTTGTINLITGDNFPPGYKISDGMTVGGVFPSGTVTATSCGGGPCPIRIQPPFAAPTLPTNTGILLFKTEFKCEVKNTNTRTGSIQMGLGVADVNGPSQPMYPWLGVQHDQDPLSGDMNSVSVLGNTTIQVYGQRLDYVDQAFQSTIPNYPNWTETPDPTAGPGFDLYPAVTITYDNTGLQDLQVGGCHVIGVATPY